MGSGVLACRRPCCGSEGPAAVQAYRTDENRGARVSEALLYSKHDGNRGACMSETWLSKHDGNRGACVSEDLLYSKHDGSRSLSWKRCAGCGGKIADRFLLYTMDSYWHSRCLKCSCCQAQLGEIGTSCYTKSGMILCRNDYIRLFGNSGACSACGQSIPASELVMRAQGNVYHLKCFTCSTCRNRLVPGDRFHYINGSLFCEHDRPTALINGHLSSLQSNPLLPDQKVC
ncbi:LIM domain transcription factor LMO4.2 [Osmerus eperlanus]|uniref:LIM domain transcription factor LMO4.2 n=1 Tax=Osmerus eperlanus TaxID=29151 RepID=UPI002E0E732A